MTIQPTGEHGNYTGGCPPEEIDTAVATACAALRDRPVLAFIPVLVERGVRRMLKGPAN
ncbi:three-helix bundle dimerization domain-containing protein [Streptomyces sp. NPDC059679]|uniref:three-helix bundle dimerization domain-containing protein n=1 Tax=Streptomyces sp. NPDC059679 TaxID=3346903 RepID=UPI0036BC6B71